MAAEITYWSARGDTVDAPKRIIGSETLATSGTSAQSGPSPNEAALVSIVCTSAPIRISYGADPTASASSAYVSVNERIWFSTKCGWKIAAVNA